MYESTGVTVLSYFSMIKVLIHEDNVIRYSGSVLYSLSIRGEGRVKKRGKTERKMQKKRETPPRFTIMAVFVCQKNTAFMWTHTHTHYTCCCRSAMIAGSSTFALDLIFILTTVFFDLLTGQGHKQKNHLCLLKAVFD